MNLEESKGLELALTHVCILSKRWGTSSVMMVSKRLAIVITYQLYITIAYLLTSVYCCTTFLNQNSMYWQIPSNKEIWHEPLNPPFVEYMNTVREYWALKFWEFSSRNSIALTDFFSSLEIDDIMQAQVQNVNLC